VHANRPEGGCAVCHNNPTDGNLTADKDSAECNECHTTLGVDYHAGFDVKHTSSAVACQGAGCHASAVVDVHTPYVGAGNAYPQYSTPCELCHDNDNPARVPSNATADCSSCHPPAPHDATAHETTVQCNACHALADLKTVHGDNCGACHPTPQSTMGPWNGTCEQSGCHAAPLHPTMQFDHQWARMESDYPDIDCWECHEGASPCTPACHPYGGYSPTAPITTSDTKASYTGAATIKLTATDASGIRYTYYSLDTGPVMIGTTIVVPAPASGTVSHRLDFWSMDRQLNTESPHKSVTFSVRAP